MRVGMEATGRSRWFERLLAELGFELWIGDQETARTQATHPGVGPITGLVYILVIGKS